MSQIWDSENRLSELRAKAMQKLDSLESRLQKESLWIFLSKAVYPSGDKVLGDDSLSSLSPNEIELLVHELRVYQTELELQNEQLRNTELALEKSRDDYFDLYENAPAGYLTLNEKGFIIKSNLEAAKLLGVGRADLINKPLPAFMPVKDADTLYLFLKHGFASGEHFRLETQLIRPDQTTLYVQFNGFSVVDQHDKRRALRLTMSDITPMKIWEKAVLNRALTTSQENERALRESEERFRQIADSIGEWVWEVDEEGLYKYCSSAVEKLLGYTPEEMVGNKYLYEHFAPELKAELKEKAFEAFRLRQSFHNFVNPNIRKDGSRAILETSAMPVIDDEGRFWGYRGSDRDVTERFEAEKVRQLLATAIEQADESILITDVHGTIQYVNPAFEKITGYTAIEAIGQNPGILKSGKHSDDFHKDLWDTISRGEVWKGVITNRNKKGELIFQKSIISPVKDSAGQIVNYVAANRDVTREHLLQEQLDHSQKMEAIGSLAGGIAHDFNNIIFAINGSAELAMAKLSENSPLKPHLEQILEYGDRAADMVRQILTFSRKSQTQKIVFEVVPVIKEGLKFLRGAIPSTIEINQHLESDLPKIYGSPTQVYQALVNLCVNAAHAIRNSHGRLSVSLGYTILDQNFLELHPNLETGECLKLTVSDTGTGISPEIMARIFEPYFTTKEVGEGTGLGLAVVYGIVQDHGGAITVTSRPGEGTTFCIFFPVSYEDKDEDDKIDQETHLSHNERILWVDDEDMVLTVVYGLLKKLGFKVTATNFPEDALELFRKAPESFDMVITDLSMPKMTGIELAIEIKKIRPEIPIVLCTGYGEVLSDAEANAFGIASVIHKPISLRKMMESICRVLETETVTDV